VEEFDDMGRKKSGIARPIRSDIFGKRGRPRKLRTLRKEWRENRTENARYKLKKERGQECNPNERISQGRNGGNAINNLKKTVASFLREKIRTKKWKIRKSEAIKGGLVGKWRSKKVFQNCVNPRKRRSIIRWGPTTELTAKNRLAKRREFLIAIRKGI
jgi:hypothetical protein